MSGVRCTRPFHWAESERDRGSLCALPRRVDYVVYISDTLLDFFVIFGDFRKESSNSYL